MSLPKIDIYKAQRLVDRAPETPGLQILIDQEIPRQSSLDQQRVTYQAQARLLADALRSVLPGGTFDRLVAELLAMKASDFIVPQDAILRAAAGQSPRGSDPRPAGSRIGPADSHLTFRMLLQSIRQYADEHPEDEALDRSVVVRLATSEEDGDDLHVGGLRSISIEAGCTDEPALVLNADQGPDASLKDDEDDDGGEG